jgi:Uma2 family endonuclease
MARTADRRMTYDDLLALPDDGLRHELIDGEHYVTPAPNLKHQRVSGNFHYVLRDFLRRHPIGEVYYAPCDVVFSSINVVEPDLLFVSRERAEILTAANIQGAPDLVIEILSPSTRKLDEALKLDLYERFSVREYWLANPVPDTVRIFRRTAEDRLHLAAELSAAAGDVLATPLLPGLEIALAEIFD